MKLSVICPVKNEADFLGYSIMSCLEQMHEFIYTCAPSTDGTDELLAHIKTKYGGDKIRVLRKPEYDFNVHDMRAYNKAYNDAIDAATGEAVFFLHPDMIVKNADVIPQLGYKGALAWWTNLTSFAGDYNTQITKGRASRWKNIQAKKFGLHYFGDYGSQNEDFYFKAITGNEHVHHGESFSAYPFPVKDSGIQVNHYCELKGYKRRLEKMESCLKNMYPKTSDAFIHSMAIIHPRVTLEPTGADIVGSFEFKKTEEPIPAVFEKYRDEFNSVLGRKENVAA